MSRAVLLASSALLLLSGQAVGQAPKGLPDGWSVVADPGGRPQGVDLATMAPGWHLTSSTGAIVFRPADRASGSYRLSAKIHLFPTRGSHREAFGLFIGGRNLNASSQAYTYFLIRGDGQFKIKRRAGAGTSDVTPWTANSAIKGDDPKQPVANLLAIQVTPSGVRFEVNGQAVYNAPAKTVDTDGVVGLRVNHNLSLHIETLELTP